MSASPGATPAAAGPGPETGGRRLLVIYNPAAGRRHRRRFEATLVRLRALGCRVDLRETSGPGDATGLARSVRPGDGDVLVAAGGDGTINEIVNGLVAGDGPAALPLAILPLGTSNVLAVEIGMPSAAEPAALTIAQGNARRICLGRISNPEDGARHFLLMAGVGFDAHAVAGVGARAKRLLGGAAYVWQGLRQMGRAGDLRYRITIDGAPHEAASVVVAKGAHYGGPFVLAPAARIDEPNLQVCLFEHAGPRHVLRYAAGLATGRLSRVPGFRIVVGARVRIEGPGGDPVQCDGDILARLPVDIETTRAALTLLVPAQGPYG